MIPFSVHPAAAISGQCDDLGAGAAAAGIVVQLDRPAPQAQPSNPVAGEPAAGQCAGRFAGARGSRDKRPIDLLANHSWSAIHHRLLGWLELPPAEYPEVAQAQALFDKLFPTGLRFIQLEYGAQWVEAEARISWLKQSGQQANIEKLCGKAFVTELLRAHTAYGQMIEQSKQQGQKPAKKLDLTALRKQLQQAILAHQLQLVALRVSGDDADRQTAQAALRPVDEYRDKLAPNRGPKSDEPAPGDPSHVVRPEEPNPSPAAPA